MTAAADGPAGMGRGSRIGGWWLDRRSWNAWGNRVSQQNFEASIDGLTAKIWTIDGKPNQSLADAGYLSAGIDEGWEGCGQGVNKTQHDANGNPVINSKFPDMRATVAYGHAKGLKVGWCASPAQPVAH